MTRTLPFVLSLSAALAACGTGRDAATAADAAATPALTLDQLAGRWSVQAFRDTGTTMLTSFELAGTADPVSWTMVFPERAPMPVRVTAAGDSVVIEAGPYESVLRAGVAVVTRTVARLDGDRLTGNFMARYATKMVDSVLTGRIEGARLP
jgi:hypothetical protein